MRPDDMDRYILNEIIDLIGMKIIEKDKPKMFACTACRYDVPMDYHANGRDDMGIYVFEQHLTMCHPDLYARAMYTVQRAVNGFPREVDMGPTLTKGVLDVMCVPYGSRTSPGVRWMCPQCRYMTVALTKEAEGAAMLTMHRHLDVAHRDTYNNVRRDVREAYDRTMAAMAKGGMR